MNFFREELIEGVGDGSRIDRQVGGRIGEGRRGRERGTDDGGENEAGSDRLACPKLGSRKKPYTYTQGDFLKRTKPLNKKPYRDS